MRQFSGKILLRVPSGIHKELAHEAFRSGGSINQICLEALLTRKALRSYDPWKAIGKVWKKNQKVNTSKLSSDIRKATSVMMCGK